MHIYIYTPKKPKQHLLGKVMEDKDKHNLYRTSQEQHIPYDSFEVTNGTRPTKCVEIDVGSNHTSTLIDYFTM